MYIYMKEYREQEEIVKGKREKKKKHKMRE